MAKKAKKTMKKKDRQSEIAALKKALRFYADDKNWTTLTKRRPFPTIIDVDHGKIARVALGMRPTWYDSLDDGDR